MPEESYYRSLYSLQDEAMQLIGKVKSDFYLTGGTALSRVYLNHRYSDDAEKDAADILYLAYSFSFNWELMINQAQQKDMWVNPVDVSKIIESFSVEKFNEVKWITKPNLQNAEKDLKIIAKNVLLGIDNELHK